MVVAGHVVGSLFWLQGFRVVGFRGVGAFRPLGASGLDFGYGLGSDFGNPQKRVPRMGATSM